MTLSPGRRGVLTAPAGRIHRRVQQQRPNRRHPLVSLGASVTRGFLEQFQESPDRGGDALIASLDDVQRPLEPETLERHGRQTVVL
jgi:hypothetical protein